MTNPTVVYNSGTNSTKVGPQLDLSNALPGSLNIPTLDSGTWTPIWTQQSGFPVGPVGTSGQWLRVGNRVSASFGVTGIDLGAGANIATISLPITRVAATLSSASGNASASTGGQSMILHGNSGNPAAVSIVGLGLSAVVGTSVSGTFVYTIS